MSTVAITLDARLDAFVDEQVRSGAFRDRAEVLSRALDDMAEIDTRRKAFEAAVQLGLDDIEAGRFIDVEDVEDWLNSLGRD